MFKGLEGAMVGAFGGGFVAAEEFEGVIAGGFLEGEGEAAVFVHIGEHAFDLGVGAADGEVEESDFNGVVAHDLPHIGGEEADEVLFHFVDGRIAGEVLVEVVVVRGGFFVVEGDGVGAEAVDHAVGGNFSFACEGDGALGEGSVGAGGS